MCNDTTHSAHSIHHFPAVGKCTCEKCSKMKMFYQRPLQRYECCIGVCNGFYYVIIHKKKQNERASHSARISALSFLSHALQSFSLGCISSFSLPTKLFKQKYIFVAVIISFFFLLSTKFRAYLFLDSVALLFLNFIFSLRFLFLFDESEFG